MSKIVRAEVDILGNPRSFPVSVYLPDNFSPTAGNNKVIFVIGENIFFEPQAAESEKTQAEAVEAAAAAADRSPAENDFAARQTPCLRVKESLDILAEGQQDAIVAAIEISDLQRYFVPVQKGFLRKNTAEETAPEFIVGSIIPSLRRRLGTREGAQNAALCVFGRDVGFALECANISAQNAQNTAPLFSLLTLILPAPKPDGGRRLFKRLEEMRLGKDCGFHIIAANKVEQDRRLRKTATDNLNFAFKLAARLSDSGAPAKLELDFERGNTTFDKSLLFFDFASRFFIPDRARKLTPPAPAKQ